MPEVFCNQCGHRNPGNSKFCSSCGAPLEVRSDEHTITLPATEDGADPTGDITIDAAEIPAGVGVLLVKRGPGTGSRFVLDDPVISAGRHPESDIFLDDVTVSRRHAEIARQGDRYVVRDVGSLNGTYVNRERIEAEAPLGNGDELQIGRFKLVFLSGS